MNQIIVVEIKNMHLFVILQRGTSVALVVLLNESAEPYSPGDEEGERAAHLR